MQCTRLEKLRNQTKEIEVAADSADECFNASRLVGLVE
jgi:hypothetical protein